MAKVTTLDFSNFSSRDGKKQPFLNSPVFPVNEAGFCTFHKLSTCMYVYSHTCIHTNIAYSIHGKLYGQNLYTRFNLVPQPELQTNSRYTRLTRLPCEQSQKALEWTPFFVHSISEVHVCMRRVYVCSFSQPLVYTFMSGLRTPEASQPSVPNLPWSCTRPFWILLCSAWVAYHSCHEERASQGWVAIDEVAIAHNLGHGDNWRSSLGPL